MKQHDLIQRHRKTVIRKDVTAKTLGEAIYTGDMKLAGLLYGKALRSSYPHALIKNINTEKAKTLREYMLSSPPKTSPASTALAWPLPTNQSWQTKKSG